MSTFEKSAQSVISIAILSTGSMVLGFVRETLIASRYGMEAETDAFFIALSAIALFSVILISTTNMTLIPILSDVETVEGKEGKVKHLNNFFNIIAIVALILTIIAFFFSPLLMRILGKGFKGEQFDLSVTLTRIGLPALITSSIIGIFTGYLQSENHFAYGASIGFPRNITYILFLFFLAPHFSIVGLMVAHVVAELTQFLVVYLGLRKTNYRYQFQVNLKDKYMQRVIAMIPPILISVAITDLNNMIDKSMASSLINGSVSALNYSSKLNSLIQGVFISALITVLFPMFSKEVSKQNFNRLKSMLATSMNLILLIVVPAAIGMIVLSTPIVRLAYQRGSFDSTATSMTASALVFYSVGLTATALKMLLTRVFYALEDTKTPMINGLHNLILNFIFNFILIQFMGHNGLALATSITTILTTFTLLYSLRTKLGNLGLHAVVRSSIKIIVGAVTMGISVYFINQVFIYLFGSNTLGELMALIITVFIGVLIYLALLFVFQVEELHFIFNYIKKYFENRKQNG